jgi:TonB family protein
LSSYGVQINQILHQSSWIPTPSPSQGNANEQSEQAKSDQRPNPDASGIYHVSNGVIAPKLIYQAAPEVSEKALKHKISGNVTVHVVVDTEGRVQDVDIFRSAAEDFTKNKDREIARTLDAKAIECVRQYRFEPGTFHGKSVPVELKVEINFQLF